MLSCSVLKIAKLFCFKDADFFFVISYPIILDVILVVIGSISVFVCFVIFFYCMMMFYER